MPKDFRIIEADTLDRIDNAATEVRSAPSARGTLCPCDGGAFCDASCECRCAEGLCGDCEPLSGEERGYCSCADGMTCRHETRADGRHAAWVADFDRDALRHHPGVPGVHSNGYVLPWRSGSVSWTKAARIAEVGGPGERRWAIIPSWEGPIAMPEDGAGTPPPEPRNTHCTELTYQGISSLCGLAEVTLTNKQQDGNVLWGTGAVTCRRCRELLMREPHSHVPIAGGALAHCGYRWECEAEDTGDGYCERHGEVVEVRRAIFRSGASVPSTDDLDVLRALLPNGSARIAGGSGEDEPRGDNRKIAKCRGCLRVGVGWSYDANAGAMLSRCHDAPIDWESLPSGPAIAGGSGEDEPAAPCRWMIWPLAQPGVTCGEPRAAGRGRYCTRHADEADALAELDRARMLSASAGAAFQFQPLEVGRGWRAGWSWRDAAHVAAGRGLRPRRSYVVSGAAVEVRLKRGDNAAGPPRSVPIADEAWRALSVPIAGGAPHGEPAADDKQIERWARYDCQVRALACMEIHALGDDPREREYIASVRRDLGSDGEAMTFPRHEQVGHGCTPALCAREGWTLRDDGELLRWPREGEPLAMSAAYERSIDGQTWESVGMPDLRRAMASRWVDVTQAITMLDEGHELPSVAAWYRREPSAPSSDVIRITRDGEIKVRLGRSTEPPG